MVFLLCYVYAMKESEWKGTTLAPYNMRNETPAWMCITREGLDQKERRDKKNARLARRKKKPSQFLLSTLFHQRSK